MRIKSTKILRGHLQGLKKSKNPGDKKNKGKEFRRIFLGVSLSLIVSVCLCMGVMNWIVSTLITQQNADGAMEIFSQIQRDFEERNNAANRLSTQILLDNVCQDMLYAETDNPLESWTLTPIYRQINQYQSVYSMVDSIYLYNKPQEMFLISEIWWGGVAKSDFWDQDIVDILEHPENYDTENLICRKITVRDWQGREHTETTYSYVLFTDQKKDGSAVVINLSMNDLIEEIQNLSTMQDSRLMITNELGDKLLDVQTGPIEESPEFWKKVSSMKGNEEFYDKVEVNDHPYFVSYLYSKDTGWNYMKVTDWNTMFSMLQELNRWFLVLICIMVIIVILIAMGNTLSVVRFHTKIEKEYRAMIPRINVFQQKETFLNDFIHSRKLFSRVRLREEMERIGFAGSENSFYTLLILQIEDYDKFIDAYEEKGIYNMKFCLQNIFEEIFSEKFGIVGLINQDDTITFLLEVSQVLGVWDVIQASFKSFCENVGIFISWNFFCLGTQQKVSLEKIPELNNDMQKYVQEGFFYPSNSCVTLEQVRSEHSEKIHFQQPESGKWKKALKTGENLSELYRELVGNLWNCNMAEYMYAAMWVGITVTQSADNVLQEEIDTNGLLRKLSRCGKVQEIDSLFESLFSQFYKQQENSEKSGVADRLDAIKDYVAIHYTDPNLTLKTLGDEFGISPNYLGRLFKKDFGISVQEYISEVRLENVLRELKETEDSAKDIAERNGFISSSNYFYTYFKKKIGVTPQMYREKNRNKAISETTTKIV